MQEERLNARLVGLRRGDAVDRKCNIFVSVPMSGRSDGEIIADITNALYWFMDNHKEFDEVTLIDNYQADLTAEYAERGEVPHSLEYLGNDIKKLKDADVVVFVKGWEHSRGANIEYQVCRAYCIPMIFM